MLYSFVISSYDPAPGSEIILLIVTPTSPPESGMKVEIQSPATTARDPNKFLSTGQITFNSLRSPFSSILFNISTVFSLTS